LTPRNHERGDPSGGEHCLSALARGRNELEVSTSIREALNRRWFEAARSGGCEGPGGLIHRRKRRKVESRRLIRETRLPGRAEPLPEPEHVPLPERSEAIAKLAQARAAALTGLRGVVGVQSGGR